MKNENISEHVGRRIRYYRELKGMTQKELGDLIGVKHNTISTYESGKNKPGENILFAIARTLGIGIDNLFPPVNYSASNGISDSALFVNESQAVYASSKLIMLPIVGRVSCGNGCLAYEDIEGYEPVPKEWAKGGKYFCLRAKGDSMIGARIHEGDLLLIREQPEVENGEIAVVLMGEEAVLKKVYQNDGQLVLQSENPNYPPIIFPSSEVKIIGKLKKLIINF